MQSSTDSLRIHIPTIAAALILVVAILMFGADTSVFSLIVSALVLLTTAGCAFYYVEMRPSLLVLSMLVVWAVFVLASVLVGYVAGAEEHYLMSLSAIAIFWLGQYSGSTRKSIEIAWRLLLVMGLIFSVFAFFQHIYTPGYIFGIEKPYHGDRLTGTFLSSNTTATFLGIIVIASTVQLYRTWRISYSKAHDTESKVFFDMMQNGVLPATTFLFAFVSLLLTASRAGIAVTLCALFLFFLWVLSQILFQRNKFGNVRLGPAILLIVAVIAVFFFFWQMSGDRAEQRYDTLFNDISDRSAMLKASLAAYQYSPIFGHGLGSLNEAKLLGIDPLINESVLVQNASHNFFVQCLVQTGVVGMAALTITYTITMLNILRAIVLRQRYASYLIGIVLISLLVCIHGLFDYALEIPALMLMHMWLLGLGFGSSMRYKKG